MESKIKLVVVFGLIVCTGIASAFYTGKGGDWGTASNWIDSVTGLDATVAPSAGNPADGFYETLTNQANPQVLAAGQTTSGVYAYMSLYDGVEGGGFRVEGNLTLGGVGYGNWSGASAPVSNSYLGVGDNGSLTINGYGLFCPIAASNTQIIDVDGGIANIALGVYSLSLAGTTVDMSVNGDGLLTLTGTAVGTSGANFSIDITNVLAAVKLPTAMKDLFIGQGSILANGVVDNSKLIVTDLGGGISQVTIPEPATLALLGLGAIAAFRRKR